MVQASDKPRMLSVVQWMHTKLPYDVEVGVFQAMLV